jgi:hypothetical protein
VEGSRNFSVGETATSLQAIATDQDDLPFVESQNAGLGILGYSGVPPQQLEETNLARPPHLRRS